MICPVCLPKLIYHSVRTPAFCAAGGSEGQSELTSGSGCDKKVPPLRVQAKAPFRELSQGGDSVYRDRRLGTPHHRAESASWSSMRSDDCRLWRSSLAQLSPPEYTLSEIRRG